LKMVYGIMLKNMKLPNRDQERRIAVHPARRRRPFRAVGHGLEVSERVLTIASTCLSGLSRFVLARFARLRTNRANSASQVKHMLDGRLRRARKEP